MSKSKFIIGNFVKDQDGNICRIINIFERDESSNVVLVEYIDGFIMDILECLLEKI